MTKKNKKQKTEIPKDIELSFERVKEAEENYRRFKEMLKRFDEEDKKE